MAACLALAAHSGAQREVALDPVVVTGTGTYHRADDSPVAVSVISGKDLIDTQSPNLLEALRKLTTTITTHTSGMGTFVNVGGVSDDYVVVLVNGKRITGDDRWTRIGMGNVKRVEIYGAAASALYGSDAMAGVVNIITVDAGDGARASISTRVRSKGRIEDDVNVDVSQGGFSSHTSYNHSEADSWQVNHYEAYDEDGVEVLKLTGRPMSAGFHSNSVSERLEYRIDDRWSAYVRGDLHGNVTERDHDASYFSQKASTDAVTGQRTYSYSQVQAYTYDLDHLSYMYGGGIRFAPGKGTHLYLDVLSDNFSSRYDHWQTTESEAYRQTRKRTHYLDCTLKGIFRLASWNKLSAGLEYTGETLSSQSDNIAFETMNACDAFVQEEIAIAGCLEAVVGLRYTWNDQFGSNLAPSAGLFLHAGGLRLRASYSGGYRAPTLSQLYATDEAKTSARYTLNNTALKPERNDFLTLNAEYGGRRFNVSVTGFLNRIRDMISYRTMTDGEIAASRRLTDLYDEGWTTIRQRDNIDMARLLRLTVGAKALLPLGLTIGVGYTFTDSKARTKTLDAATQTYVTTTSPVDKSVRNVFSLLATWDATFGKYHVNVTIDGHVQGARYSSTYGYADPYGQWDVLTRHSITLGNVVLEPAIGIENILNQRDTSPWNSNFSTINPGRSALVGMAIRYAR